jgi:hypothetical protein
MAKKFPLLCVIFITATTAHSQIVKRDSIYNRTKSQWTLNTGIANFGIGKEVRLSPKTTIIFDAGIGWNRLVYKYNSSYNIDLGFPALYASINPRFYYNMNRRANLGKNISNNAANYFGLLLRASTYPIGQNYGPDLGIGATSAEIHWGMQRNLGKGWLFDFRTGIGVTQNSGYGLHLYPAFNIRFAKTIFRRK